MVSARKQERVIYLLYKWGVDESGPYPIARDADCSLWGLSHITRLAKIDEISAPVYGPIFNLLGLVNLLPK